MNVLEELKARGLLDDVSSEELEKHLDKPQKIYIGFDPTADSLHLGNFIPMMVLAHFQRHGHTPVVLLGGATGRIGDPSGKSIERPFLKEQEIDRNVEAIGKQFSCVLDFSHQSAAPLIVNNVTWFEKISVIEFMRDIGKFFRMGSMIAKESVRERLKSEQGMSFTEFSYQLFQGYDFYYLHENHGISVQGGGSEQWGNITAGIEFTRKKSGKVVYGLTFPLLLRSDGKKFGKSEEGAIWLSSDKCSVYNFYQYLVRVPDADVIEMLKKLTFLPLEKIHAIKKEMEQKDYVPNTAQKILAEEVTRIVHGEEGVKKALSATEAARPGQDASLTLEALEQMRLDLPHKILAMHDVAGKKFVEVATLSGLLASKSEGVRLIKNGGGYLNNERVEDPSYTIAKEDLIEGRFLLLAMGKKRRVVVEVEE